MRYIGVLLFFIALTSYSQEELANDYFRRGEFDKALTLYQEMEKDNSYNYNHKEKILEILRQLQRYEDAKVYAKSVITNYNNPIFLIELGYIYQLQDSISKANKNYDIADQKLNDNPNYAYMLAKTYEKFSLLDRAAHLYHRAMEINPSLNFNIQLARIYGEQGDVEKMLNSYMDFIFINPNYKEHAKRAINDFISEDSQNENNQIFKRILLKKIQQEPNLIWNELLSWLFIQQKDYKKAFAQEKAIFRRNPESLERIIDLAIITIDEKENDIAKDILNYLIETAQDTDTKIKAEQYLIELETNEITTGDFKKINNKYESLIEKYGRNNQTLKLQLSYANFLGFYYNQPDKAIEFLKDSMKLPLNKFQEAELKLKLGDILVFQEKFNEALIYYTQIQQNLKNNPISQEARFRVAKTSYYKGDFDWAESQLTILKSSTSQLIANDALELKLLISDNKYDDSTQTALKLYAKADLLAFQNKNKQSVSVLEEILVNHKGESIEDQALFLQAKLFEKQGLYNQAASNYQYIISNYNQDILVDDAIYRLAELYNKFLNDPKKAKDLYEQILFNHQDSIYFVEARKKFRTLRGDDIN